MPSLLEPSAPFVGRDREVELLADLLRDAPAVLVTGRMGVGKSRLLEVVLARQASEGYLPRAAWTSLAGVRDPRTLLQRSATAVGLLLPGQVVEVRALVELLGAAPHTLVWDDAHAAAAPPLLAVLDALLAARAAADPSRLVLVARSEAGPALRGALEERGLPALEVPPLDPQSSVQLLQALEHARGRTLYEDLAAHAGGNPLGLQLSLAALAVGELDPAARAREILAALAPGARGLLELLIAAEVPVPLSVLEAHAPSASAELPALLGRGLARVEDGRIHLAAGAAQALRPLAGEPGPAAMTALAELADRLVAAAPHDPALLQLACAARARRRGGASALALLRRHPAARGRLSIAALRALYRAIAVAEPRAAPVCQLLLAEDELRAGDFAAAERTLSTLPAGLREDQLARAALLRARALARAGSPAAAGAALARVRRPERAALADGAALTTASLELLRGGAPAARRALRRLRPGGPRALLLGASYLAEGRLARLLAATRLARRAAEDRGEPADALVAVMEVLALLSLDQLERAGGVADRQAAVAAQREDVPATTPLLQAMVLERSGALAEARRQAQRARRMLQRRADRLLSALAGHLLFRCALGTGALERAEELARELSAAAEDPGLAALQPAAHLQSALLHEARGEESAGAEHARRALAGGLRSPRLRVEAWALAAAPGPCPTVGSPAGAAYGALRSAERGLAEGRIEHALASAGAAARWFATVGTRLELARARLAWAEGLARDGRAAEALAEVDETAALARRGGYAPLAVGAELVRAFLAERAGDPAGAARALAVALEEAGPGLTDRALRAAARRAGLPASAAATVPWQPFHARVARLGLDRPVAARFTLGERSWPLAVGEPWPVRADLVVRPAEGDAFCPDLARARPLSPLALKLLVAIARAGAAGVSLEELHTLRGGRSYHPLRHRNAIYVALTRLRESLAEVAPRELLEVLEGRCRIAAGVQVAVVGEEPSPGP
jgi:tetratricopeptide (TPR) repeat protein